MYTVVFDQVDRRLLVWEHVFGLPVHGFLLQSSQIRWQVQSRNRKPAYVQMIVHDGQPRNQADTGRFTAPTSLSLLRSALAAHEDRDVPAFE